MKDVCNNDLVEGDNIVFIETNYAHLRRGVVEGFTPKKIKIRPVTCFKGESEFVYKYYYQVSLALIKVYN